MGKYNFPEEEKTMTKILIAVMMMAMTLFAAGCGSTTPSTEASGATQTVQTKKGLTLKPNFLNKKISAKTVHGGTIAAPTDIRDRTPEMQGLVTNLEVIVQTYSGHYVGFFPFEMSNGAIVNGTLPLNVGQYTLSVGAYSKGHAYLFSCNAQAEVSADGQGEVMLNFEPVTMQYFNVRINNLPGNWSISNSNMPVTNYYVNTSAVSASHQSYDDYDDYATVNLIGDPADPATKPSLSYATPVYFLSPDNNSFDPTVSIFFQTYNNDGQPSYGEYQIDIIEAIKAIDEFGQLSFDYPQSGSLILK